MKIIVPMSGLGSRFVEKGYSDPKPLINVQGKPIIEHIINLFGEDSSFIFICNSEHIKNTNMKEILESIAPNSIVLEIPKHKLGPVYACTFAFDLISEKEEVIVSYCDFGTYWNFNDFKLQTSKQKDDGVIVCYKGFHPHMLHDSNYAFVKTNGTKAVDIKEKASFTDDKMSEYASNGIYYFKSGELVKKYFNKLLKSDMKVNGEFYVSMIYKLMLDDNLDVSVHEIEHMLQWGTPRDLEEYLYWVDVFNSLAKFNKKTIQVEMNLLVPMAGKGQRFIDEGYKVIKPLIELSGEPMIHNVLNFLPKFETNTFVVHSTLKKQLKSILDLNDIVSIESNNGGQATSTTAGVANIKNTLPIFVTACDSALHIDYKKLNKEIQEPFDLIVLCTKDYPYSVIKPEHYGWVNLKNNKITSTELKKKPSAGFENLLITGSFIFKNKEVLSTLYKTLEDENIQINNEYYLDSMIDVALSHDMKVKCFLVDQYISWGTPDELKTFEYWQRFFTKDSNHIYSM